MRFHGGKQQVLVAGPLLVPLVVGDDLVLRFLQLHQLAKLVGLARLPFAYDFRVVKRHLVCKRWTIEKADENSNDTPWFALHRPNSDKLRFHLPSLPWHWFDARILCSVARSDWWYATPSSTSDRTGKTSARNLSRS